MPFDDVREVSNHVRALEHALGRIRGKLPVGNRLLEEVHGVLLAAGRGSEKSPGEFRRSQNWIGGARPGVADHVPPPPEEVAAGMGELEKLPERPSRAHTDASRGRAGACAARSIHPFLDGNGRLGRSTVPLLLCAEGVLTEPLLHLSLHPKQLRGTKYDLPQRVRSHGDWEAWVEFFVRGVGTTASQAVSTAQGMGKLFRVDRERVTTIGRPASSALRLRDALQARPILSIGEAVDLTGLSMPTVISSFGRLEELGIVRELTGRERSRLSGYEEYLRVLSEGAAPG